jgi:hypothetical protein
MEDLLLLLANKKEEDVDSRQAWVSEEDSLPKWLQLRRQLIGVGEEDA